MATRTKRLAFLLSTDNDCIGKSKNMGSTLPCEDPNAKLLSGLGPVRFLVNVSPLLFLTRPLRVVKIRTALQESQLHVRHAVEWRTVLRPLLRVVQKLVPISKRGLRE